MTHATAKPPHLRAGSKGTGGEPLCRFHSLSLILSWKRALMWWYLRWDSSRDRRACQSVTGSETGPVHLHTGMDGLVLCPHANGSAGPGRLCHLSTQDASQDLLLRLCTKSHRLSPMHLKSSSSRWCLQWGEKADPHTGRVSWGHVQVGWQKYCREGSTAALRHCPYLPIL